MIREVQQVREVAFVGGNYSDLGRRRLQRREYRESRVKRLQKAHQNPE